MTRSTTTPSPAPVPEVTADPEQAAREAQRRETRDRRRQLLRRVLVRVAALVVFLGVWWLITALQLIKPLYLPSPGAVWDAFVLANTDHPIAPGVPRMVKGEQNYYLWEHLIASLQRIGVGVGWAIIFGPILGFVMASFRPVATIVEPYLNFLRALPPLGYIGILIVWFGIGDTSKMWLLFLAAFPPITIATINGVRSVKEERINGALSLGASRLQTITHVVLPSTLPDVISGIRIAIGFAWTTVVAAELNNGIPGIGGLAYLSGTELKTPLTIACIIVIGIAAILLDLAIKGVEKILVPWRGKA
ncbi:taurine ABC transporter permease [Mycolicibacterium agri]|uniref:Putative ABC transporter, permease protein n=1 Tax=Mycolicibacterium agri TaxID=36811 RepID=A0A2A7N227_MYCAG|nr:ABC transporter permease [Mycolicibacterium agri]PEG37488.1 taurine ABC transporter permease [Mycolicibacterium agri]GFG50938.1 putative ABC transporter, permease protein [Mycolicibacterium agri]